MKTVKTDLTVVGAGYAGLCAAIAAARHGVKVALVNDRDVLGGNASSEHRIHVNSAATGSFSLYGREGGIADELKMFTFYKNPNYNQKESYHLFDMALLDKVLAEKNIELFLGTVVYDCECENDKITKAFAVKPKTNEEICFESDYFCDASGDGILAFKAGCEFRMGREASAEFNESLAPEKADDAAMPSCVLFTVSHTGKPVKFTKPDFAYNLVEDDKLKYFEREETGRRMPVTADEYQGIWWLEVSYPFDTIKDSDEIDFELRKLVYGYWDYIKNSGKYPEAEDMVIDWIAPYASKRESRRFIGDYILNQNDINNCVDFEDKVSHGGWSLDIHDYKGVYGDGMASAFGEVKSLYSIPFSIMYSKDKSNLFLTGRIASCTHVAMGSTRVIQTLGAMGHAVGVAASLCKEYKKTPKQIRNENIDELQNLLQKDGQFILHRKEDCGFVSNAKITASSQKLLENLNEGEYIKLDKNACLTLPVSESFTKEIQVKIKATSNTSLKYRVCDEVAPLVYLCGETLFENSVEIEKGFEGFVVLPIENKGKNRVFIELLSNEDLEIFVTDEKISAVPSYIGDMNSAKQENSKYIVFKGVEEKADTYSVQNIKNGYSRPYKTANCWVSNGTENEWLEIEFPNTVDIKNLQIYFDAQFETEHFNEKIKRLVSDYKMTVTSKIGQSEFVVSDNYMARNSFDVDIKEVEKIRFDFIKNN
ncbi:MAG: FAD-dependent oxidoreductase, partial [Clostridia bacterium]|nr:FAD-dependent oxidoreductase [Clostridia bacterium]